MIPEEDNDFMTKKGDKWNKILFAPHHPFPLDTDAEKEGYLARSTTN